MYNMLLFYVNTLRYYHSHSKRVTVPQSGFSKYKELTFPRWSTYFTQECLMTWIIITLQKVIPQCSLAVPSLGVSFESWVLLMGVFMCQWVCLRTYFQETASNKYCTNTHQILLNVWPTSVQIQIGVMNKSTYICLVHTHGCL